MASLIITTPGAADANSYCEATTADALLALRFDTAAWDDSTTEEQEIALIWATRLLNAAMDWYGCPSTTTQALDWPQIGQQDKLGRPVGTMVYPQALVEATAFYALALGQAVRGNTELDGEQGIKEFEVRGDQARVVYATQAPPSAPQRLPLGIVRLLTPFGESRTGVTRRLIRS